MINDFDPNVHLDNMGKPGGDINEPSGVNDDAVFEDAEAEMRSPVRLAAQSLISHFINHLFHFPMETGNFYFLNFFQNHVPIIVSSLNSNYRTCATIIRS